MTKTASSLNVQFNVVIDTIPMKGIGRRTFYYVDITLNPHRKGCMPNASTILRRLWMESAPFPWWWFSARMAAASDGA
jgi:hypothetical protein